MFGAMGCGEPGAEPDGNTIAAGSRPQTWFVLTHLHLLFCERGFAAQMEEQKLLAAD